MSRCRMQKAKGQRDQLDINSCPLQNKIPQKGQQRRQEMGKGRGGEGREKTHTWPQQQQCANKSSKPRPSTSCTLFNTRLPSYRQVCMHVHQPHDSRQTAGSGVARQTTLEDMHTEQTDSLPPSNMGMVFMKNSLEATWSASKTQMSSEPGTRVPGGYIWEHTLLTFPDFPFISPAPNSKLAVRRSE